MPVNLFHRVRPALPVDVARNRIWVRLVFVVISYGTSIFPLAAAEPSVQLKPAVDLYGDPLPEGAVARFGSVRFRHGDKIQAVAYSPDGKTIASGGRDRVILWEAATGKALASMVWETLISSSTRAGSKRQVEVGSTRGLAFTADGQRLIAIVSRPISQSSLPRLASQSSLTYAVLWDLKGRTPPSYHEMFQGISSKGWLSLAFSPDGNRLAVGTSTGDSQVLDLEESQVVTTVGAMGVLGLLFSPDGKLLTAVTPKSIDDADLTTGRKMQRLTIDRAERAVFGRTGESVWVGRVSEELWNGQVLSGDLKRWDLRTGSVVQTIKTVPDRLLSLAVSPDEQTLAICTPTNGLIFYDTATGRAGDAISSGSKVRSGVNGLAFAPDGKSLATAGGNRVRTFDVPTRRERHQLEEHVEAVCTLALAKDGKHVATAGRDGMIRTWDVSTGRALKFWATDPTTCVDALAYTPDGRHVVASEPGLVRMWDASTGNEVRRFEKKSRRTVEYINTLSPDGTLFAACWEGKNSISLYDVATGRLLREFSSRATPISQMTFAPDGRWLFSVAEKRPAGYRMPALNEVQVWDTAFGGQFCTFDIEKSFHRNAMSPDGKLLISVAEADGDEPACMKFRSTQTGTEFRERRIPKATIATFSPNGHYVAIGVENKIRLIELVTGQLVQELAGGVGSVTDLVYTPGGRRLLSAHRDGTTLVWDLSLLAESIGDRNTLWDGLASKDAAVAYRTAGMMVANPSVALAALGEKLRPAPKARTTAELVAALDDPAFTTRDVASRELRRRVEIAPEELKAALGLATSAEVRLRLNEILNAAPSPWPKLTDEELRQVRAVGVLEMISTPDARRQLKALAGGDLYALLTREARAALRRLGE
ncbi:WD40 repeat domain-containing protein [Fimbriiglobus ruber]|uniref:High-affnity carbon uptake protein Hat/HatR n=1 Tax=Fimbriiglobus ruber TaxID=1908690 RepID=A0A225EET6_9BACT|nr:WD40 repeat domain-containing protein [Fimbriiglobus ruber]OWK46787.1 High-affnity carbon uptake protein Hat/HatR [Fimbriiglobus ruber]